MECLGHNGGAWATSKGFQSKPEDIAALIKAFSDASGVRASGLKLGENKYIVLRADDRSVYGKKGATGVVCVKTKQAVLVGFYGEATQPGEATKIVESLADYLISVNY